MASITHILAIESTNTDSIHLHKEGLFWKAYQQSAYRINSLPCVNYKLTKKHIKAAQTEVISLGFPSINLSKHFKEEQIRQIDDFYICITDYPIDVDDYSDWFASLPLYSPPPPAPPKQQEYVTQIHVFEPPAEAEPPLVEQNILRRLREFHIEQATPLQCMCFLSELRKELIILNA